MRPIYICPDCDRLSSVRVDMTEHEIMSGHRRYIREILYERSRGKGERREYQWSTDWQRK